MGTEGRGLPVCALAHPRAGILSDNGRVLSSQPNFAAFIKELFARMANVVCLHRTRSGLSLPPSFPLVKEIWARHWLPKPCPQQAHGAAQQSRGTKGQCSPQELALGWLAWLPTPRWFLVLRDAEPREHSQPSAHTAAWAISYPQLGSLADPCPWSLSGAIPWPQAAVHLGDKSP